jgi:hypothetical protein
MGTDFNIKPVGGPVAAPVVRPQPEAVRAAVPTELPSPKAVTSQEPTTAARNDPQPGNSDQSYQVVIDRAAATIVYRLVDSSTRLVLQQYPDEARLRSRAYQRALDTAKLNHTPVKISQTA